MPSETGTYEHEADGAAEHEAHAEHGAHEESLLAHPHPTVLNAYPLVLEAFAGRYTQTPGSLGERFTIAGQRVRDRQLSPTPATVLQWVPVTTLGSWCVIVALLILVHRGVHNMRVVPGRLQNIFEWTYQTFDGFSRNMIGQEKGSQFTPLLATFFIYIFFLNLGGIVPGFLSATTALNTTIALALCCFLAVQYFGFKHQGVGYLMHFVGEPWWLFPINIPIHILGEFARPLSLSVRLFGNIFGEDTVIAQLILLGVTILAAIHVPIPIQFPMLLFGIFGAFVQALVFTMLSASYIASVVQEHGH